MWIGSIIWGGCASLSTPVPEAPPAPTCVDEEGAACLSAGRSAEAAGDWAQAADHYAHRCATRAPGDVGCRLAERARRVPEWRSRCEGGDAEACSRVCTELGDVDACTVAVAGAAEACNAGAGARCKEWAMALEQTAAPDDEVNRVLWRGCDESETVDAWSCWLLADRVERGRGILPEVARGDVAWLRNQACDLQLAFACAPRAAR